MLSFVPLVNRPNNRFCAGVNSGPRGSCANPTAPPQNIRAAAMEYFAGIITPLSVTSRLQSCGLAHLPPSCRLLFEEHTPLIIEFDAMATVLLILVEHLYGIILARCDV